MGPTILKTIVKQFGLETCPSHVFEPNRKAVKFIYDHGFISLSMTNNGSEEDHKAVVCRFPGWLHKGRVIDQSRTTVYDMRDPTSITRMLADFNTITNKRPRTIGEEVQTVR